ncbi:MAG: TIGR04206 family protein [Halobacteriota archaeon]
MVDRHSQPVALAVLLLGAFVPWVLIRNAPGNVTFVMAWGLANPNTGYILHMGSYLGQTLGFSTLPQSLQAWPIGATLYGLAIASAAIGAVFGREDPRLTGGLVVFAAIGGCIAWTYFAVQGRLYPTPFGLTYAIPIGPIVYLAIAWWFYWPRIRNPSPRSNGRTGE